MRVGVSVVALRGQRSRVGLTSPMWMLGIELLSSVRGRIASNSWAIPLARERDRQLRLEEIRVLGRGNNQYKDVQEAGLGVPGIWTAATGYCTGLFSTTALYDIFLSSLNLEGCPNGGSVPSWVMSCSHWEFIGCQILCSVLCCFAMECYLVFTVNMVAMIQENKETPKTNKNSQNDQVYSWIAPSIRVEKSV